MQRAALYIRVSTEEQAIHGLSIDAQREALDAWAKRERVLVVDHFVDAGISARKPAVKRPELQRLLRRVEADEVDMVVFTKLDRWFRNVAEYYKVQEILEAHNVTWKTIHEDYETATSSGRLKVNIMLSVAQDEADRTGERIRTIFQSKRSRGEFIGSVPMGFRREGKFLVVDEAEAEVVRWIFDQYIATRSRPATSRALLTCLGLDYTANSLSTILSNRKYIGEGIGLAKGTKPIVAPETFALAQEISRQRSQRNMAKGRTDRIYLFTGIACCAECGGRMAAQTAQNRYTYYYCHRRVTHHTCTHDHYTSEEKIERWLLENVLSECEGYNIEVRARQQRASQVDEAELKRKLEKLQDLYMSDLIERDYYEREYKALREAIDEAQLAKLRQGREIDIPHLEDLLSTYDSFTRQARKEFWTRIISKIIVTNTDDFSLVPFSS